MEGFFGFIQTGMDEMAKRTKSPFGEKRGPGSNPLVLGLLRV
jgi:hypothetical protein